MHRNTGNAAVPAASSCAFLPVFSPLLVPRTAPSLAARGDSFTPPRQQRRQWAGAAAAAGGRPGGLMRRRALPLPTAAEGLVLPSLSLPSSASASLSSSLVVAAGGSSPIVYEPQLDGGALVSSSSNRGQVPSVRACYAGVMFPPLSITHHVRLTSFSTHLNTPSSSTAVHRTSRVPAVPLFTSHSHSQHNPHTSHDSFIQVSLVVVAFVVVVFWLRVFVAIDDRVKRWVG